MTDPDLTPILVQRNARLRAWQSLGVPVTGGWLYWAGGGFTFLAGCGACGAIIQPRVLTPGEPLTPAEAERDAGVPCPHLAPLLGEDSPEVLAVTELELLAG